MGLRTPVDLDQQASTPLDPRVRDAMVRVLDGRHGNPSSDHALGWSAAALIDRAREQVAAAVGGEASEVVFTSGATEACNLALLGVADLQPAPGHLILSALEHAAVLEPARVLVERGWELDLVPCGPDGIVDPADVAGLLRPGTALVSLIGVQNEIGTVQPWRETAALCRERGVPLHLDAAQALGRVPLHALDDGLALVSISGHKIHGPMGVGALITRRRDPRLRPAPRIHGGGQQRGLRAGTLPTASIVGLGEACRLAAEEWEARESHVRALTTRLYLALAEAVPDLRLNGSARHRMPGNLSLTFPGVRAADLRRRTPTLAYSTGSACSSSQPGPSRILKALGLSDEDAACTVRLGLGKDTTEEDVDEASALLIAAVREIRG